MDEKPPTKLNRRNIDISDRALAAIDEFRSRGMKQKGTIEQILEWFGSQDPSVRRAIVSGVRVEAQIVQENPVESSPKENADDNTLKVNQSPLNPTKNLSRAEQVVSQLNMPQVVTGSEFANKAAMLKKEPKAVLDRRERQQKKNRGQK